ncbi:membrane fusion protein (multidrug efflux system) [Catalinimonas alkaloidigena]|uniref:efflux RND transporter periplasmic adaptor subunit n=1 Tax=Catalinimonas alkaloidigena TaxID=1075417 RepID=UPI002404A4EF|nr:efflux RND transporter periplasmic adaptor subunit [Catalinimonas alkaloidigena]MDF9797902.1 membrane fusion protein (multidrug efflux system) [Catalinimonas alkaloidigena]
MMKRNILSILPVIVLIAGCSSQGAEEQQENKEEKSITQTVQTVAVKKKQPVYTLSLPGELHPYEEVALYAKLRGFVKKIHVDRGSEVKKGQLLAVLDAPEITQQYIAAKAKQREVNEQINYSLQAYRRLQQAAQKKGAVASIELEEAKARLMRDSAAYLALQAEMEAAQQLKDYAYITAPFDGVITDRKVSPGALVGENSKPLFALSQQDKLRLTVAIPEKHARALNDSSQVTFTVSGQPGKTFSTSMSRSSTIINPEHRALMVEFDIDNQNHQLSGGEYAQVQLALRRPQPSLQLPASSIVQSQNKVYVARVENQTIQHIVVERGISQDSFVEVFGNLEEKDEVVLEASEEMREGMKVQTDQVEINND